jgi:hypothetical protein
LFVELFADPCHCGQSPLTCPGKRYC